VYDGGHVRDKAARILKKGWYDMAGSDCHKLRSISHLVSDKLLKKDGVKLLSNLISD